MHPVQPGWVAVPVTQEIPGEWYHIVGWTRHEGKPHPIIAGRESGIHPWFIQFGEDPYVIATLEEWTGAQHCHGASDV